MTTHSANSSSDAGTGHTPVEAYTEKPPLGTKIEHIPTHDRVPGHTNYYERDGLRTVGGDDLDHEHEPPMTKRRLMSLIAMAFLWTGSQIPVYLFGGVPPYIYADIGGADRWIWLVLANLLSLAAVCPFVGSLSDLFGRRYVAIAGSSFIILGMIVCSTAHTMNTFICGMTFAGIGAAINELTALAATSELAPTAKRGKYVAILIFTILPFAPSVLWGQLISYHSTWRYCGLLAGIWSFIGLVLTVIFYHPPPRVNSQGLTRRELVQQIDFVGGFLSISGMLLFMMGMQWGGYQYDWSSAHVLAPLILGVAFVVAFCVWEAKFASHPMFPRRLIQVPNVMILTLIITFISGANFFSIIMFWPTQAFNVYGHDPVGVGLRGLPVGFGILAGAFIALWALSVFRGGNKIILIIASVMMTAGCGALAAAEVDNLYRVWGILVVASLGIGGIVVPASIMTTIVCPDDLIATVTALTLSIRVIGGSVGYCIYYNVFANKFEHHAVHYIGGTLVKAGITSPKLIGAVVKLTAASLLEEIHELPGIKGNELLYHAVVKAGQIAYAEAYKWVYYVSIAFGGISIIAAVFLGDIGKYMDDHVAVVM
ncbi:MFS general substrate transporter [Delitschia confertaspora ATCC 74209]|uniref:MFS general substrate transporter n=1 Tax=Delitschia confertaspora ATCC 74209 TaxID=1513339 RepID=A0A9P4JWK3_9PLEO|nr:MFS general substrate transporter [Delitschia confertaspora ATCC 74209]